MNLVDFFNQRFGQTSPFGRGRYTQQPGGYFTRFPVNNQATTNYGFGNETIHPFSNHQVPANYYAGDPHPYANFAPGYSFSWSDNTNYYGNPGRFQNSKSPGRMSTLGSLFSFEKPNVYR